MLRSFNSGVRSTLTNLYLSFWKKKNIKAVSCIFIQNAKLLKKLKKKYKIRVSIIYRPPIYTEYFVVVIRFTGAY